MVDGCGKRGQNIRSILESLALAGEIILAAAEPRVNMTMRRELSRYDKLFWRPEHKQKKFDNAFYYLRKKGLIDVQYRGHQMYFSLTVEGKKKAGKFKVDGLKIKKPKKWDKVWRILIFDISDKQKMKREALRGKIKELGLYQLQKSVWVCPYEFKKEMTLLRDFFGLSPREMTVIVASHIENDGLAKRHFGLG